MCDYDDDWTDYDYSFGPAPDFPGIDEFYATHRVVNSPDELTPGKFFRKHYGCEHPALGGYRVEILEKPEVYQGNCELLRGNLFVKVRHHFRNGYESVDIIFLEDHGIMPEGKTPHNKNRLVYY